jgi:hypothetical protein
MHDGQDPGERSDPAARVFYSSAQAMKAHQGDLPFAIISDPGRALYEEFGVQIALRPVLSPGAWVAWAKGAATLSTSPEPPTDGESKFGLPAEFLIGADGRVQALKYGAHAYDQWSVIDATQALNLSAGVSNCKVSRGRSLS